MALQRVRQADSTLYLAPYIAQHVRQTIVPRMLDRELQRTIEWHSRTEQRGGAAGPQCQSRPAAEPAASARRRPCRDLGDGHRIQLPTRQILEHFASRGRLERP